MQVTRDEDVHAEFSGLAVWRARWGDLGSKREIKVVHLDGSVHFRSHFSALCPPYLQRTQEMHFLSEFSLLVISNM